MFALSKFIATSQHYFVTPMPSDIKTATDAAPQTGYADEAPSSRLEDAAMALATTLAGLTYFTAVAAAV
ncbi:hypothetical protein [Roseateles sp.]|uniref:hypothetical protein n=1 Tax=Roseateles sp. TaxID=1971397 RepID=UPI00286BF5E7|nr:hypothetical protein [Roseateles sp.]